MGKLIRFDDVRGYGFIAPADGGEDVFVHANDFGELRRQVHPGMRVEYEEENGDRGRRVAAVRILQEATAKSSAVVTDEPSAGATDEDDGFCDVLRATELTRELTELLLQHGSTLTAEQILHLRDRLVGHARSHGWVAS